MNWNRIASLSGRVVLEVFRDKRSFVLLIVIPVLLLLLADKLFESDAERLGIGLVNLDSGVSIPGGISLRLGDSIEQGIRMSESLSLIAVEEHESEAFLASGQAKAVLFLPANFSASFVQSGELTLDLKLEGSNPALSQPVIGQIHQIAIAALAQLAAPEIAPGFDRSPVRINADYFYGGEAFGMMDYVAPVYIAFLVLFFVFLITCVSLIRERNQGTLERLLASPTTRFEIIAGYIIGLGVYALLQGAVILTFSLFVLKIVYAGSLWILFLIIAVLSIVGVALGMLASSFARNEFQVVLFIPLLIIPQMLLGGTFIPVDQLPPVLTPLAYSMPLTYANMAMQDVMIKGWNLSQIYLKLLLLGGFAVVFVVIDVLAVRRKID